MGEVSNWESLLMPCLSQNLSEIRCHVSTSNGDHHFLHQLFQKMLEIHEIPNHPKSSHSSFRYTRYGIIQAWHHSFPLSSMIFPAFLTFIHWRRFPRKPSCLMTQKGRWCWLSHHFKIPCWTSWADWRQKYLQQASLIHKCCTLWLCQNSYWKCWFIVDFPIKNGDFP